MNIFKNKKIIILFFVLLIIICFSYYFIKIKGSQLYKQQNNSSSNLMQQKDSQPEKSIDSEGISDQLENIFNSEGDKLVYVSDFKIYLYNPLTNKQASVPINYDIRDICIKDGNTIYYTSNYVAPDVYSYNFKEKKIEVIKSFDSGNPTFLSSDCKYVYFDDGTSPECRSNGVFNLDKNEFVDKIGGIPTWSPDKNRYVFGKCNDQGGFEYYVGELDSSAINKLFLKNQWLGNIRWVDNDNFLYSIYTFSSDDISQDVYNSRITTYYIYNFNTGLSSPVNENIGKILDGDTEIVSPSSKYKIIIGDNLSILNMDDSNSLPIVNGYSLRGTNGAAWLK